MHQIRLKGLAAELRWGGYQKAADLGVWSIDGTTLTAEIVARDAFRLVQTPLSFEVRRHNGARWAWPILSLAVDGSQLTATIGPQI